MHIIAAKAVCFQLAMTEEFNLYQQQILKNSKTLCEAMKQVGYRIVSGGTDTHLFLVDLRPKKLTGKVAEENLEKVGITVNRNTIPFDTEKPTITSGLRIGTPALTTRDMKESEMTKIASLIDRVLTHIGDESVASSVKEEVKELCEAFPLYKNRLDYYRTRIKREKMSAYARPSPSMGEDIRKG